MTNRPHAFDCLFHRSRGFTLVEVLVALFLLSLVSVMAWQGIDNLRQTQTSLEEHVHQIARLQSALLQWRTDLDSVVDTGRLTPVSYDGRLLRLTRRQSINPAQGMRVVAWFASVDSQGQLQWSRWQSPPVVTQVALDQAWLAADAWSRGIRSPHQSAGATVLPIRQWRLFYFRQNGWSNPLSEDTPTNGINSPHSLVPANPASGSASSPVVMPSPLKKLPTPQAIRLELDLGPGAAMSQTIRVDWMSPALEGQQS